MRTLSRTPCPSPAPAAVLPQCTGQGCDLHQQMQAPGQPFEEPFESHSCLLSAFQAVGLGWKRASPHSPEVVPSGIPDFPPENMKKPREEMSFASSIHNRKEHL